MKNSQLGFSHHISIVERMQPGLCGSLWIDLSARHAAVSFQSFNRSNTFAKWYATQFLPEISKAKGKKAAKTHAYALIPLK